jgi:hypothetical protein
LMVDLIYYGGKSLDLVPICDIMAGLPKSLSDLVIEARSIGSNTSTLVIWSDLVRGVSSPFWWLAWRNEAVDPDLRLRISQEWS